nr:MAG TPA: hypothetical protein [Caudoviricetes sp.]
MIFALKYRDRVTVVNRDDFTVKGKERRIQHC